MMQFPVPEVIKEQVVDAPPKRIKELKFGILSTQDIINQGVLEVCDRTLYDLDRNRAPRVNGPLDERMGTGRKNGTCDTCGADMQACNGHFGLVKLSLPAFHIGYIKLIITILQEICKDCSRILLPEEFRRSFLRDLRRPNVDNLRRTQICKKILAQCKKTKNCPSCGAVNGAVKKLGQTALKIVHDKYRTFNASNSVKKVPPPSKVAFDQSLEFAKETNKEVATHFRKAQDDMNPLRVLNLFKRISPDDCELLGMNPEEGRPEMFIWQYVPAPPVCIRPSVAQDMSSTEDDITQKLSDIIHISGLIREGLANGSPITQVMEQWDFLQLQIALYINSDVPGLQQQGLNKAIRGFCQRLKGKQGRFRGNLSGKRVDYSGRTVISPDPNLCVDEVAVPELVAKNMTYPERVTPHNLEKLRNCVRNGLYKHPGALYVNNTQGKKLYLKYGVLSDHARRLQIGDIVERHLEDGDIVLFNRQPSLHKLSILCHRVKVRPFRTFRLNECVCNPYNADFDGDEMNLHVPQTEEARTEAIELMGVKHNLVTPKNGEPIISAIQDFITAAYLLSSKDIFYDRKSFTNICMYMVDAKTHIEVPPPTILKPVALWTGKQIFNVLIRPNKTSDVLINLDAPSKEYRADPTTHHDLSENDGWLCIRNSEVMCGVMDKYTIGSGKKDSVFYVILRDYGPDAAIQAMNRLSKLSARWLTNQGFSIGIGDVYPGATLLEKKRELVESAYAECAALIAQFKQGSLEKSAGCDEEQTLENKISGLLSKVRMQAGDVCLNELSRWNAPLIMAKSGSKGSFINVSQMVATVGQQIIGGKRVEDGFQDRSLPHFAKNGRLPPSKGFVRNSFFSGLNPAEFIFHAMSGREGLVDTAVKTAETGYMSRRLMKSLEDLSSQYDNTVRNSSAAIVQFKYGDDMLDPADMEGNARPVNFDRTFMHAEATTWDNNEQTLLPWEINELCEKLLAGRREKLKRTSLLNKDLDYDDKSNNAVDQQESERDFLDSIATYIGNKAGVQAVIRKKLKLSPGLSKEGQKRPRGRAKANATHAELAVQRVAKMSATTLIAFVNACLMKYNKAHVEPGQSVGAVGAQSIGEPGTQMTLKTFHFAGVAGMSITEGVPRIKEIINASKSISTPIITCDLENKTNENVARVVKGFIEKTYIRDIASYIDTSSSPKNCSVTLKVDTDTIGRLQLDITTMDVVDAIMRQKKLKIGRSDMLIRGDIIRVYVSSTGLAKPLKGKPKDNHEMYPRLNALARAIPNIVVRGYPDATRAVINKDDHGDHSILVEGYGLRACMSTPGVNGLKTKTNSVLEMRDVLGIEAARKTIIDEISLVMKGMDIDPRHMQLLADVMTYKGEILGITRFGLSKMRDSVLQLASFEKTPDHLFEAAWHMKSDLIEGVSECIIMGQTMNIGTGAFKVVQSLNISEKQLKPRPTVFEDTYDEVMKSRVASTAKPPKGRKRRAGGALQ